jgi:hypothetical protein
MSKRRRVAGVVGSQPPQGYIAWHEWADAQHKGGLRQKQCGVCGLWRFPQEMSGKFHVSHPERSDGTKIRISSPICKACEKE